VAREAEEVLGAGRLSVLHEQGPAAEPPALCQDRAVRATGRDVELGGDWFFTFMKVIAPRIPS
jgi:hypothetical protein